MSSDRDRQLLQARELDRLSTAMIAFGVNTVKKNPIKVGCYLIGILVCLFFNGWAVVETQRDKYQNTLNSINYNEIEEKYNKLQILNRRYYDSKGWFSCDYKVVIIFINVDDNKIKILE